MPLLDIFKNNISALNKIFSGAVKEHKTAIFALIAVYFGLNFAAEKLLALSVEMNLSGAHKIFTLLLTFSFISAAVPIFLKDKFIKKEIVPGLKYILYSCIVWAAVSIIFFPFKIFVKIMFSVPRLTGMDSFASAGTFFSSAAYMFISVFALIFVLFCMFDFLKKASIDEPVLNSFRTFKNNKLFVFFLVLIFAGLSVIVSAFAGGALRFFFELAAVLFVIAVYFSLNTPEGKDGNLSAAEKDSFSETAPPRIKINI